MLRPYQKLAHRWEHSDFLVTVNEGSIPVPWSWVQVSKPFPTNQKEICRIGGQTAGNATLC